MKCISKYSFPNGSAGGIDGLKPQFLKDVISVSAGEAGKRVLTAITDLCNFMLAGKMIDSACPFMYGASLFALTKKDGGVRPIAVGNTFRRLTAKLACCFSQNHVFNYLSPTQLGVGVSQGCEASIHAIRTYVNHPSKKQNVLLKIDFLNAFNSISREVMLKQVQEKVPSIYPFINQCYRNSTNLFFGKEVLSSEMGCQQGDPCGPLLFSLAIHPIVQEMTTDLNSWYLDDATLGDSSDIVLENFAKIIERAALMGLKINPSKCEIHFCSQVVDAATIERFNSISPGIRVVNASELNLLGAPVYEDGFKNHVLPKVKNLKLMCDRLGELNTHVAYVLLKNCLLVPKLTYLLRTSPFWKFVDIMESIDDLLHNTLHSILNTRLDESQWKQATLPISCGGIGIRMISDLALPAFLSSSHGAQNLVSQILSLDVEVSVHLRDEAVDLWHFTVGGTIPEVSSLHIQKEWDTISTEQKKLSIQLSTNQDKARFLALQSKEAGAWLQVFPSTNIGTFVDNTTFRTCVGLRLGCKLFQSHQCGCGTIIDERGLHALSCAKGKGRFPRHAELNDIIHRSLSSIHVPSTLEPVGMYREDGKRPDGVSLVPWSHGKMLVWDCTCINTLAETYLPQTIRTAGAAAAEAEKKKMVKYNNLVERNFIFKPLAFETMGPWGTEVTDLVREIGEKLVVVSGDPRARCHLIQRLSLAVQRGNSASLLSGLPASDFNEVFML